MAVEKDNLRRMALPNEGEVEAEVSDFRIVKKMSRASRGALKLARQFGDPLVCVRYRVDDKRQYRYTTIELVVERTKIRATGEATVGIMTHLFENELRRRLQEAGAHWDAGKKLWRLPQRVAVELGLGNRIVYK